MCQRAVYNIYVLVCISEVSENHSFVSNSLRPASLSITNSYSLSKLMSIGLVMPSNHLILLSTPSPPALNLSQDQDLFK